MKMKVLLSWKARIFMESDIKYRNNKIYSDFCDVIHSNSSDISILRLRLRLIKILNTNESITVRIKNFYNHIFSKTIGISEMDINKIIISWNLRTKLEKNKKYIYSDELKAIYEHLSNILHGEVEKHNMSYIKKCEQKVEEFFDKLRTLHNYSLKDKRVTISLQSIDRLRKKRILSDENARNHTIFFFKATFSGKRIAFIENDPAKIERIMSDKYMIIKYKSKDIGIFEFVDRTKFYTFIRAKNIKAKNYYHLYN